MDGWMVPVYLCRGCSGCCCCCWSRNSPRTVSIFRQTISVTTSATPSATSAACQVSPPDIGDMSQTLQRSIFNERNKKKEKEKKHRQTVGTIVGVPGSFHTGVAMQHICTCTHGTIIFLLLSSGHHQRVGCCI